MSSSEHDTESSNFDSPLSHTESPYSSPLQRVPQFSLSLNGLYWTDDKLAKMDIANQPFLRIIEQPQDHFRFRYKSEMVGTHGCLLGKSYVTNKAKTHPTVELVNYSGRAIIRCRLSQHNNTKEHPHKLLEDEQDRDVSYEVPEHGSYKVGFAGMGIIHTAKKEVPGLLYNKIASLNSNMNPREIRTLCENEAKNINLNIVRLRFSAHDIVSNKEICAPVFSEPIHNMKSAATNDLKICRISRTCSRPRGGDDVYIFVEKVNKKNIKIRFFEIADSGEEVWSAFGHFLESDVHHQYAIVFRTPQYKDPYITADVKVYIELVRPLDGRTSERKEFTYKAEQAFKQNKKRKANSSYSSLSSSGGSFKSLGDLPATVMLQNNMHIDDDKNVISMSTIPTIPQIPVPKQLSNNDLGNALLMNIQAPEAGTPMDTDQLLVMNNNNPMLGTNSVTSLPDFNSTELRRLLDQNSSIPLEDKKRFCEADLSEYLNLYPDSLPDEPSSMNFIVSTMLIGDSGRGQGAKKKSDLGMLKVPKKEEDESSKINEKLNSEYSEFYTAKDGMEVKRLVAEICELIRQKTSKNKALIRLKLEQIFEKRLSSGGTFLHMMTNCDNNATTLLYIVKLIYSMNMTHLLNLKNNFSQTILHLAIVNELPDLIRFFISKGCDPMQSDLEGNNAIHLAACRQDGLPGGEPSCLETLLAAIDANKVPHDLNAINAEHQTPLHLAVMYDSAEKVGALIRRRAKGDLRDVQGRTPLHRAADMDHVKAMRELLNYLPQSEVDALDDSGYTALQIVCGGRMKKNTLEMVKLLLDKKADPIFGGSKSAWRLAAEEPEIRAAIENHPATTALQLIEDIDIKSEPEDDDMKSEPEDESDDENCGESLSQLVGLVQYRDRLAVMLDSGAWRQLAERLDLDSIVSWLENTVSPTQTLLNYLKESGNNISSGSLANTLDSIGQNVAAKLVRSCAE